MNNFSRPRGRGGWLALLCCWALSACAPPAEVTFSQPPIIIVNVDTLRADHLGCYGYSRATSPSIDAFSQEAVRFEWAFSQGPNTPPSQASILTSLYPTSHGRIRKKNKMSQGVVTLAEVLNEYGYDTAAFVDGGLMGKGFGLEQGFDLYDDEAGGVEAIGPKARKWLSRRLSAEDPSAPFLLLLHTYDVHSPYEISPRRYRPMFLNGLELPPRSFRKKMSGTMFKAWKSPKIQLSPQELAYTKAKYDSGIRHVDDWFGSLMRFLDERGILEQSIVVLISDHGDEFQEHGSLFHDRLYATVTRIPLIIRLPGGRTSRIIDDVVESIDLMPTLLELVDAPAPSPIHGRSLVPMIEGREQRPGRAISESPLWGRRIAVATPEYRLFRSLKNKKVELYAYREDPLEQTNLADLLPDVVGELVAASQRWEKMVAGHRFESDEIQEFDPEAVEQLKALGYLD